MSQSNISVNSTLGPTIEVLGDGGIIINVANPVSGTGDVTSSSTSLNNQIVRFDGTSGKIIQNSGITIADGATGTLSGTNTGDQNLFGTFAVAGQSNVVADSTNDTLTLVAGSNITITTNATTDAITINSTASSSGDVVGPSSATDNAIARYDQTTGKLIQDSGITIADGESGTLSGTNTGDVTLAGSLDYLSISGQEITLDSIDLATDVTGNLPLSNMATLNSGVLLGSDSTGNPNNPVIEISIGGGLTLSGGILYAPSPSPSGDVFGPSSATNNAIVRFDTTTGKLIQDSGITIADGESGTLSGTNSGDQNLFGTISVAGQSDVVADTTSDTLTLVAGTNISITTDATTDTITINSIGSGSGDVVGPASATDNALVRYDGTTGKLVQNGQVTQSDTGDLAAINSMTMDTTPTGSLATQGQMMWNSDEETLDIQLNGFALHVGEHVVYHVQNSTGSTIAKGVPVMFAGTTGNSGKLLIQPWNGTGPATLFMGITGESLTTGSEGFVIAFGKVRGIQTNGANYGQTWVDGEIIYAGTTTGSLTKTQPSAPNPIVQVLAVVHAHASNGTYFIRPNYILGDVFGPSSSTDNALVRFDGTTGKLVQVSGITVADGASGTLSGTNTGDQDLSGYATISSVAAGYQPLDTQLTAISALSDAAGVLTNDGSGAMSYTPKSVGVGNSADDGKLVIYGDIGQLTANSFHGIEGVEVGILHPGGAAGVLSFSGGDAVAGSLSFQGTGGSAGTIDLSGGDAAILISDGLTGLNGGNAGSLNMSGSSSDGVFNGSDGGSINTSGGINSPGGYINTSNGGGYINTSSGGGYISTTNGGSITSGTGNINLGNTSGTLQAHALTATIAIANGGTGQTTAVAAFDALAPTTTKGDLIVSNGTDNIRVAVGATNGHVLTVDSATASGVKWSGLPFDYPAAVSDETTSLTAGASKLTFRMPCAVTLTSVRASVGTAPTGSTIIVDINENGTSILSTKLSIDATEKTSTTAAVPAVISDSALADDAEITIDIDQIGSTVAGAGLKIVLIGTRS